MESEPADPASPGDPAESAAAAAGKLSPVHLLLSPVCLSDCSLALLSSNQSQLLDSALRTVTGRAPVTPAASDITRVRGQPVTHLEPAGTQTHTYTHTHTLLTTDSAD